MNMAWDALVEGWRELYHRAADALTRFTPQRPKGELLPREEEEFALRSSGWGVLAAEVFDDDDQVVVRLEAPGMEPDEFTLQVIGDRLWVRGRKQLQRERTEGRYHVSECAYGSFERAIRLPDEVDSSQAKARYRRGVLRVELPQSGTRRRRRIKVDVH
jgi:HSP20 family protein